jgi:colanic acid biosynthesis glycosyl transferase WcaI
MVTGVPHYPAWRRSPAPSRAREQGVEVRRRRHFVPGTPTTLRRGLYEGTWVLSCLAELARQRDPDLVLGVVPSFGGAVLASAASRRYGVPYVLLFQDLMGKAAAQSGFAGGARVAPAIRPLEAALARGAAAVAIVAEGFRDYFLDAGVDPDRIVRLRNPARLGESKEARADTRRRLGWSDRFVVIHTGSIGFKQGLENVVGAAALAADRQELLFVLQGDGNRRAKLEADVTRAGLENVAFLPLASEEEFPAILKAADCALLNQRGSVLNMSLPAKLATYFTAGLPVVAAVAAEDETAREIELAGGGLLVEPDRPAALLAAVDELRADEDRARALGRAGKDYAERFLSIGASVTAFERFLQFGLAGKRPGKRG